MNQPPTFINERVDDLPLLTQLWDQLQLAELLDSYFPTHGNWQGLSLGQVVCIWLTYILSQADHRLSHVQDWATRRLHTLQALTSAALVALDLSDDRLARVLRYLSDAQSWQHFEQALNRQTLRVYDLSAHTVRLDATTVSGYWQSSEGLIQFGHSKDHRPDLRQFKVMLATLDPLAMPLAVLPVAGNCNDDPLYLPAVAQVRASLGQCGLLYVGDCKMAALLTRATLVAGGDYYLMPLSETQFPTAQLDAYIAAWREAGAKLTINPDCLLPAQTAADGFEISREPQAVVDGQLVRWQERVLIVRSPGKAAQQVRELRKQAQTLKQRLEQLNLRGRGRKRYRSISELQLAAELLLTAPAAELLQVRYTQHPSEEQALLRVVIDEQALAEAGWYFGWRAYATNQRHSALNLAQAVAAYASEYLIEHGFSRLKGQSLGLDPVYLQRDDHISGLVRLLSIGLRGLAALEYQARVRLSAQESELRGLYAGQPQQRTARPTAERLLGAFKEVGLMVLEQGGKRTVYLTALTPLQQRILELLGYPATLYQRLATSLANPP
jgi:transposase